MVQYARPNSDIDTGWNAAPTGNRYATIDEVVASDSDYISRFLTAIQTCGLSTVTDPSVSTGHIMRIRAKIGSGSPNLTYTLKQNTTTIVSQTIVLTSTYTVYTYTLSAAEANSITDYTALRIEFNGSLAQQVSWFEFEVPNASSTYSISGVTKDDSGTILGSCECYLLKDNLDGTFSFISHVTSNVTTGAYSFTGITDNLAQYQVIAWKDTPSRVFDVTDWVLTPI